MKLRISIMLSVMLLLAFTAAASAQTEQGDLEEELLLRAAGSTTYDCELVENGDYYMKYVYLYAGQDILAGRTKITIFRRDNQYRTLRFSLYTEAYGYEILESHLYVGKRRPRRMAPGRFPYKQETPSGSTRVDFYVDLDDIGASYEHVYLAIHAVVQPVGETVSEASGHGRKHKRRHCGSESAWGYKTAYYPVMRKCETLNPNGDPWGTIFPRRNKQWPAYFKVYIPYNVENPWYECPQPLQLIFKY